ncbi:MAG: glycosyltransferase family 39 protein [Bryobacteraceae bacterium]
MFPSNLRPQHLAILISLLCILFFFSGFIFIPHIGIQTDEAIFSSVLFDHPNQWFVLSVFKRKLPLMVMSYLGTVKSALYYVVWKFFAPSVYSLRIPALLLGVASLPAFFLLLRRITNIRVALTAAALLSTDTSYILTSTMDWGPVAIQHLSFLLGCYFTVKSIQDNNLRSLAGGAFWFGLGFWDKALMVWMLSAATIAAVLVFHQEIKRNFSPRRIIVFLSFFLLGALPIVIYNIRKPLETFRGNTTFSRDDLRVKMVQLPRTTTGAALFGWLVADDWSTATPKAPQTALERFSLRITTTVGQTRENLNWWALLLSVGLTPFLVFSPYRRPFLFVLLMTSIAWAEMLATRGAGGGTHHTILLWPFPLMLIAIAAVWLTGKTGKLQLPLLTLTTLVLCTASLLVTNQHFANLTRYGTTGPWTDAHFALSQRLGESQASIIFLTDWGMLDNTRMLHRGRLPLFAASEPLMKENPEQADWDNVAWYLRQNNAIFASNTDDRQVFPNVNPRLKKMAEKLGYRRIEEEIIRDANGRPAFELFRYTKSQP